MRKGKSQVNVSAMLLAMLVAVMPTPAGSQSSTINTLLTTALQGVVKGFTGAAGNQLWGWMLGGGQSAGLGAIASELSAIETTLKNIDAELVIIAQELEELACDFETVTIESDAATAIDTWYGDYTDFLTDMQMNSQPSVSTLQTWANNVINGTASDQSALSALTQLHDVGTAGAGSNGSIAACIVANGTGNLYQTNMLDDRPYYDTQVLPIQNWFLSYNTRAMIIISEAYHILAWIAAGQPQSTNANDIIPNVCPQTGTIPFDCAQPGTIYTNQFLPFTKAEFAAGGAPYSTDDYVLQIGTDYLMANSIEGFNAAAGNPDNCATSQTSADPCGVTVGVYNAAPFQSIEYGPYNYGTTNGTWEPATSSVFLGLFDTGWNGSGSSRLAADFLCTMSLTGGDTSTCTQAPLGTNRANGGQGLSVGKKIVVFDETTPVGDNDPTSPPFQTFSRFFSPVICFFDGNLPAAPLPADLIVASPFCQKTQDSYFDLAEVEFQCVPGEIDALSTPDDLANGTFGSNPKWYYLSVTCNSARAPLYSVNTIAPPTVPQFRWPVLDLSKLTCTESSVTPQTSKNPAGALMLCGNDFDTWFNTLVPPNTTQATVGNARAISLDSGDADGFVRLAAHFPLAQPLDLCGATLKVSDILNEAGREMVTLESGFRGVPEVLTRLPGAKPHLAVFEASSGESQIHARLAFRNNELRIRLHVSEAFITGPFLCDGQPLTTAIETAFLLTNGGSPPIALSVFKPWRCVLGDDGDIRVLRLGNRKLFSPIGN